MKVKAEPSPEHTNTVERRDGRREVRISCQPAAVQVCLGGSEQAVAALVVEVSTSGLQLLADEPVPVGSPVRIDMGDLIVQGEIRHCERRLDKRSYTVGVKMHDVTESDRGDRGRPGTGSRARRTVQPDAKRQRTR